jgi:hypothetical protein
MIALASDCLVFRLASGESVAVSAEMLSVELMGSTLDLFDPEFVRHAAHAVFHYFQRDQGRETVTVGEFTEALEKVLRGLKLNISKGESNAGARTVSELDLARLARESGEGCELFFFPRLRDELRQHLGQSPQMLRFHGLRGCVKELMGARRWTLKCQALEERIVEFLRECLGAESKKGELALVVD